MELIISVTTNRHQRPKFSSDGLERGTSVNNLYKKREQAITFTELLNVEGNKYIKGNSFLSRGHLAPNADFAYSYWQQASFFYINVCPQWQIVNAGNWGSVENEVRSAAGAYKENFTIITGTHKILSLHDINNKSVDMYLDSYRHILPVPKFMWKIVYSPARRAGIVFISANNPFIKVFNPEEHQLCQGEPTLTKL